MGFSSPSSSSPFGFSMSNPTPRTSSTSSVHGSFGYSAATTPSVTVGCTSPFGANSGSGTSTNLFGSSTFATSSVFGTSPGFESPTDIFGFAYSPQTKTSIFSPMFEATTNFGTCTPFGSSSGSTSLFGKRLGGFGSGFSSSSGTMPSSVSSFGASSSPSSSFANVSSTSFASSAPADSFSSATFRGSGSSVPSFSFSTAPTTSSASAFSLPINSSVTSTSSVPAFSLSIPPMLSSTASTAPSSQPQSTSLPVLGGLASSSGGTTSVSVSAAQTSSAPIATTSSGTTLSTSAASGTSPKLPPEITGKTIKEEWNAEEFAEEQGGQDISDSIFAEEEDQLQTDAELMAERERVEAWRNWRMSDYDTLANGISVMRFEEEFALNWLGTNSIDEATRLPFINEVFTQKLVEKMAKGKEKVPEQQIENPADEERTYQTQLKEPLILSADEESTNISLNPETDPQSTTVESTK